MGQTCQQTSYDFITVYVATVEQKKNINNLIHKWVNPTIRLYFTAHGFRCGKEKLIKNNTIENSWLLPLQSQTEAEKLFLFSFPPPSSVEILVFCFKFALKSIEFLPSHSLFGKFQTKIKLGHTWIQQGDAEESAEFRLCQGEHLHLRPNVGHCTFQRVFK